jgi:predicted ribosome quality control (RQC) complex YloA/Tae2 family protein
MKVIDKYIEPLGITIQFHVGKNAQDNFDIIENANPNDIWFHIDDNASCHVIGSLPEDTTFGKKQLMYIIKQGAIICKQFSKYKSHKNVSIVYTPIKNVTMTDIIGSVVIQSSKNISI